MKKISRRSFLSAMGIVGAAAALTACGGSSSSTAASSSAASTAGSTAAAGSAEKPADYPNASMSLVVGFNPGGDSDLNNRLMAQYVEPSFGQSIAVTNMAGSNSSVALTQYQSTPTDGYTILGTNSAALVNNYASGTCQYSYEDFEVIAVFGRAPGDMLFANKASGITSMEDLLEKSKANPNSIKMGMSSGGNTHVYALLLQQAGFACNIVDGGDGSDRIAALVGGHVDVCFVPYLTAKEYVENGDVVPLCTIGDRCSALPDTLRSPRFGGGESVAELHPLDGGYGEEQVAQQAFGRIEERLAPPCLLYTSLN